MDNLNHANEKNCSSSDDVQKEPSESKPVQASSLSLALSEVDVVKGENKNVQPKVAQLQNKNRDFELTSVENYGNTSHYPEQISGFRINNGYFGYNIMKHAKIKDDLKQIGARIKSQRKKMGKLNKNFWD